MNKVKKITDCVWTLADKVKIDTELKKGKTAKEIAAKLGYHAPEIVLFKSRDFSRLEGYPRKPNKAERRQMLQPYLDGIYWTRLDAIIEIGITYSQLCSWLIEFDLNLHEAKQNRTRMKKVEKPSFDKELVKKSNPFLTGRW